MDDATHHWPMDKLDSGGVGDIAGSQRGVVESEGKVVKTGPYVHKGFTTGAISLSGSTRDYVNLGDFDAVPMMDLDWSSGMYLKQSSVEHCTGVSKPLT